MWNDFWNLCANDLAQARPHSMCVPGENALGRYSIVELMIVAGSFAIT
jgi:hypothetical protein